MTHVTVAWLDGTYAEVRRFASRYTAITGRCTHVISNRTRTGWIVYASARDGAWLPPMA